MSTILDALRKVERERDPSSEAALDATTVSSEPRRRRSFPLGAIVACALVGFGGGAILSWWLPGSESQVEVASLPEPPPPPAIDVPRPPLRAKPGAPTVPIEDHAVAMAPPAAVAPATQPPVPVPPAAVAPPDAAAPPAPPPAGQVPSAVDAPAVALEKAPPAGPAAALPKATTQEDSAVAAIDPNASALEPSPFKPSRDPAGAAATEPAKKPVAEAARASGRREPEDLAALAPAPATEPDVPIAEEAAVEPDAEPETSPETLVDTGRSPPGAPKVALSFLQWSTDPARRFAFISIDGAPTQRIREGEVAAGLTVAAITPTGVQFKREGTVFVIRPRH